MDVNINGNDIVVDKTIDIQSNFKEKISIRELGYKFIKRIIDIIGGLVGIIVLIPIIFCVYVARVIRKENDGPLFYEQLRIGKNGKEFRFYKFRSMVMNADEKLYEYLEQNEKAKQEKVDNIVKQDVDIYRESMYKENTYNGEIYKEDDYEKSKNENLEKPNFIKNNININNSTIENTNNLLEQMNAYINKEKENLN